MTFNELDKRMRAFETACDRQVTAGAYMVMRIDGRSFTRLTKTTGEFEAPFDVRFRDLMVGTAMHLMDCGFHILYAYTQSDEISLLIDRSDTIFERRERKIISILAGEASAAFSVALGRVAAFDCRISELAEKDLVTDYFRWRQADARRNTLNSWCYWTLRKEGMDRRRATKIISGKTTMEKIELLSDHGTDYERVPLWQKNGIGLWWQRVTHEGFNPVTKESVTTLRNRIAVRYDMPDGAQYGDFIGRLLEDSAPDCQDTTFQSKN